MLLTFYILTKGAIMKQRTIDSAREARLWLRDIIIPAVGVIAFVAMNKDAYKNVRDEINHVLNRKPGQP